MIAGRRWYGEVGSLNPGQALIWLKTIPQAGKIVASLGRDSTQGSLAEYFGRFGVQLSDVARARG
jgi:hypothetical protein